jgi:outer membrane receptor protein involved in Fe transport
MHVFPGFVLLSFVAAAAPALALEGRVIDERSGAPIANAEVSVLGYPGVTTTDQDGRFTWTPDPAPPFEVLVVLPGGRVLKPVLIDKLNPAAPIDVRVEALVEEAITVSGSAPHIETTPASGTTLLPKRDLSTRQPATLVQALENVAGASTVSEGQSAVPALRGMARGRTLLLIDGSRVTAERRVGPAATFLDPFVLENVEVSRGPGSVAYGSDAFGGVILARTRRVPFGSPIAVDVTGGLGAGVPQGRAGVHVGKGFERGSVGVQGHYREAEDWSSPVGEVLNSGWQDSGFALRGEHEVGRGILAASFQSDFGRDVERPRNNSNVTRFYYPTEDSRRFTTTYDLRSLGPFTSAQFSGFLGTNAVVTDQDRIPTATVTRRIERADVSANDFHVRGSAEKQAGRGKFEVGADVNGRFDLHALDILVEYNTAGAVTAETVNVSVDNAHRLDVAGFLQGEYALRTTLLASAGLRGDSVTTENTGGFFGDRSTSNGAFSGFGALTAGPFRGWSLTGQLARGFRDPTLSDRYSRGPSGRGFITGNPDLEPETSLQFDGAVRFTAPRVRLGFFAFRYEIDSLIERYQTTPDNFFFRNRDKALIRGVEVEVQADLQRELMLQVAAHLQRGKAVDDDAPLDDISPSTISAQLTKAFGLRGFAYVRGAAYARDDRPGPNEVEVAGYGLVDVAGGYRLTDGVELRLNVRNLFDHSYLVNSDQRATLAPGISALATVEVRLPATR